MKMRRGLRWVAGDLTPVRTYLTRVINFGTWEEWRSMRRRFKTRQIREVALHPLRGQWTRRGRALAEVVFDCKIGDEALISYHA